MPCLRAASAPCGQLLFVAIAALVDKNSTSDDDLFRGARKTQGTHKNDKFVMTAQAIGRVWGLGLAGLALAWLFLPLEGTFCEVLVCRGPRMVSHRKLSLNCSNMVRKGPRGGDMAQALPAKLCSYCPCIPFTAEQTRKQQ